MALIFTSWVLVTVDDNELGKKRAYESANYDLGWPAMLFFRKVVTVRLGEKRKPSLM